MKVTTLRELLREQANAAVQVSGAHHSSWNNRYGPRIPSASKIGGTANWDHSISYNPRHVDERLQEMFRNARVHNQDPADLRGYRDALRVVLHENVHLLASEGREYSQAQAAFQSGPGVRPLEEGITELYSHQKLNEYIDELGIDQIAPGIKNVHSPKVYKEFTPAVEGFADAIERRSGVQRDDLIGRLAVVPPDQKFKAAAEAMYDNSDLRGLMPPDQREQAVAQIAQAMGRPFGEVERLPEGADPDEIRTVGAKAAGEGYKAISRLKKQWQMPAPSRQVQRGVGPEQRQATQSERGDGAQPPTQSSAPAARSAEAGAAAEAGTASPGSEGAAPAGASPAARAHAGASPASAPELPPDIAAAARAGLSGPPLASASRLSPDRQGARGTGSNAPAAERQGPETQR
ncbi:hypothetical protein OHA18_16720 [Kribbella sp. NBC_00709]|uniref:hypothetical protein n=1 Tax=Kribbella sp. NBC_00709 TaxID=2975972 RepID=UPI002E2C1AFB|nr:hypothetical protein [Kribbella sp. NBC_00709]